MLGILLAVLFTFALGGMLLMLFLGARGIENEFMERAGEARKFRAHAARIPRFFVVTQPAGPAGGRLDDALVWHVQQYLEAEQTLADEFMLHPAIERLYRGAGRRLTAH